MSQPIVQTSQNENLYPSTSDTSAGAASLEERIQIAESLVSKIQEEKAIEEIEVGWMNAIRIPYFIIWSIV